MKNMTLKPATTAMTSAWQPTLSATLGCATTALATYEVQGIAVRPVIERDRAVAGAAHRGGFAAKPGSLAWSPPS